MVVRRVPATTNNAQSLLRVDHVILAVLIVLLTAGVAPAADPIRVGFLAPMSGIFAQAGKDMLDGLKMGLEQAGGQVAGRKIELIEEDDEGNPATAQAKYRQLVQQDKVHVLTGVLLANIGYALVPPIERDELPSLFLTTPDDLTKRRPPKWILCSNFAASQPMHALGDKVSGRLQNTVIHTYPMVAQFWTYKPEEFLKTPAYDRSYPPVKP